MAKSRTSGQGRPKGVPNKLNGDIKAMILGALQDVGGQRYLAERAVDCPTAFLALLGRILPMQVSGQDGDAIAVDFRWADATPAETDALRARAHALTINAEPAMAQTGDD